jgi:hypothetical protein
VVLPGLPSGGQTQPQVRFIFAKLTVTVPLALIVKTVVWWPVIDEPSAPVAWMVRVSALF